MKIQITKLMVSIGTVAALSTSGAMAASVSESFGVTLELVNSCEISTAPSAIAFSGSQTLADYVTAKSTTLGVTCGTGLDYTVTADDLYNPGTPALEGVTSSADVIPYTLAVRNSLGTVTANGSGNGAEQMWTVAVDLDEATDTTGFTSTEFQSAVNVTVTY